MIHTVESLRAFTARVAAVVDQGTIPHPVHLAGGNEQFLIDYFARYHRPGDWVFGSWRSHYHALLAGVPGDTLFEAILTGQSIALQFPKYNVLCSAIVAGQIPIALGVAMAISRCPQLWRIGRKDGTFIEVPAAAAANGVISRYICGEDEVTVEAVRQPHVHVFAGDMASETGLFHECKRYAVGHDLPITFIIEDNSLSVCTPTQEAWGPLGRATGTTERQVAAKASQTVRYTYDLAAHWPHSGAKRRTNF